MEITDKFETLVASAEFDSCGYSQVKNTGDKSLSRFIYHAVLPNGGSTCLFKVLQTNVCLNDCAYCSNQIGRDVRRFTFQPDELATQFMEFHRRGLVQGLFLSSGIKGRASSAMESMLDTVEILRRKYLYKGYVHLKIMPGSPFSCVEQACRIADRVSVNIEAPTAAHLAKLSERKNLHDDILERMRWVSKLTSDNDKLAPSGQTTQFVVGAAGETDRDILSTTQALHDELGLRRAYFSAFSPVDNNRLEGVKAAPPMREHRLYQVDWLLRVYKFPYREAALAFGETGNLNLKKDPKLAIAEKEPWLFPIDINRAGYDDLLRIPGIGPISARRVVENRKERSISSVQQLQKMGVVMKRALPYIWLPGITAHERQLCFLPDLPEDTLEAVSEKVLKI